VNVKKVEAGRGASRNMDLGGVKGWGLVPAEIEFGTF